MGAKKNFFQEKEAKAPFFLMENLHLCSLKSPNNWMHYE